MKISGKIVFVLLAVFMLFGVTDYFTSVQAETKDENFIYYGDVDEDGYVNTNDALAVLKHDVEIERITASRAKILADINKDGKINALDALQILKTDVRLVDPIPYIETEDDPTDDPVDDPADDPADTPVDDPVDTPAERQYKMHITIGEHVLTATLVQNSSTDALLDMLSEGPITINMNDYANMEKVGSLPASLPRNDEQIHMEAGDLILYQGNSFVIYYDTNAWSLTRLGKIENVTQQELKEILGNGSVTVVLSLLSE